MIHALNGSPIRFYVCILCNCFFFYAELGGPIIFRMNAWNFCGWVLNFGGLEQPIAWLFTA